MREEEDESEDQIVYRHDSPTELLGLYRQRHQLKAQTSGQGIITKGTPSRHYPEDKKRPENTSVKVLLPPSAVEEAAWASLTQANVHRRAGSQHLQDSGLNEKSHQRLNSTEGHQEGSDGASVPGKTSWAEALQQLISQEVHSGESREPLNVADARPEETCAAEVGMAQTPVTEWTQRRTPIAVQGSKSQPERRFGTFSSAKGKQKRHPAERFRITSARAPLLQLHESSPVPLAQRLQELVGEDCRDDRTLPTQGDGGATISRPSSLSIAGKLQSLIESSGSPRGYQQLLASPEVTKHSPSRPKRPVSTVQNKKAVTIQDDIVECANEDEDENSVQISLQGSLRYLQTPVQRNRNARNVQKRHPVYKNELLEDIDNYDDFYDEETSTEKSLSVATSTAPTSISERFRDALLSSAPAEVTSTNSFGLSARLEAVLSAQKNKHMHFTKLLQGKHSGEKLGQCLEVVINGTKEEAQLTVCRCEVLRPPENWIHERNSQRIVSDNRSNLAIIDVIFSKVSSGVDLHVGRVIRIHPPWQEVPRGEQSPRLIFCTFFCEVLR
ncbi:hypothetical protein R1flu_023179 [Riccia fluitans]|uniref:Uncharacterized protein n=1 Tax=Riccia fluitans TaxID=41844 RepID=A0ABD1XRE9_9MARC